MEILNDLDFAVFRKAKNLWSEDKLPKVMLFASALALFMVSFAHIGAKGAGY